ncbi:MAG: carboxypeptidase regulatory-like domain-containing protein, partial [Caldilineaceae bacterium]|nr:carboxypeptidase regulatory-like domain-containing protein [Caldilineaceae bacterium]
GAHHWHAAVQPQAGSRGMLGQCYNVPMQRCLLAIPGDDVTRGWLRWIGVSVSLAAILLLMGACRPTPESNVAGYLLARQLGTLPGQQNDRPTGTITGRVTDGVAPLSGATVVVAEADGTPHIGHTNTNGYFQIDDVPAGQYVPAGVAPGYAEQELSGLWGIPALVTVRAQETSSAPELVLSPYQPPPLPTALAAAVNLRQTAVYTAAAPFPANAVAQVQSFAFDYDRVTVDSLRLYLPDPVDPGRTYPLLFAVYPTAADDWEAVSVAFAAHGFAVAAISPVAARGVDVEAHAQDARVGLALARSGALHRAVGRNRPVAMAGSFSSAIVARLIRAAGEDLAGWITVGGLADAFRGAADFYAGRTYMPPPFELLVPAMGAPNLYPLEFLRYSPVYVASELPPTMIVHTAADRILPITQAYELEKAARAAGIPVDTYYYEDVSHYLGIGENMTDAGREMFFKIVEFVNRYGEQP